eukprot:6461518-Amphidinium_carterae.1
MELVCGIGGFECGITFTVGLCKSGWAISPHALCTIDALCRGKMDLNVANSKRRTCFAVASSAAIDTCNEGIAHSKPTRKGSQSAYLCPVVHCCFFGAIVTSTVEMRCRYTSLGCTLSLWRSRLGFSVEFKPKLAGAQRLEIFGQLEKPCSSFWLFVVPFRLVDELYCSLILGLSTATSALEYGAEILRQVMESATLNKGSAASGMDATSGLEGSADEHETDQASTTSAVSPYVDGQVIEVLISND